MNVFNFRNQIIQDYSDYVSSFISIAQPRLNEFVKSCFASGSLWPDPLIQLNPTFKPGKTIDELVSAGVLKAECSQVFPRVTVRSLSSDTPVRRMRKHAPGSLRAPPTSSASTSSCLS